MENTKWYCENCGEPINDGDEIISEATGEMTDHPEVGDHFIMHAECLDQKLERFKDKRIKEILESEFDDFRPQYYCNCTEDEEHEEMWPKADIEDWLDGLRFLLRYGADMGEVGKVPSNWKELSPRSELALRRRVDRRLEELMKEEGFE